MSGKRKATNSIKTQTKKTPRTNESKQTEEKRTGSLGPFPSSILGAEDKQKTIGQDDKVRGKCTRFLSNSCCCWHIVKI